MFPNRYCNIKKCAQEKTEGSDSYFLKLVHDEYKQVDQLKDVEKLATAENPRTKFLEESSDICNELRECKVNDILRQKRRQQLRANSHELRQLEKQLQSALVTKQLKEQQQMLAQQRDDEISKKREENAQFAAECELVRKSILQQEEEEKQKKDVFRGILKCQIGDLRERRRKEFENVIKDRDEMEKLLKRIKNEEMSERTEAEKLRERCKKEMEESYRNRELQRQLEKERNVDDTERNLAYQKQCDNIKSQMVADRIRIQKEKEALSEQIGQQLSTLHKEKEKRESLLLSLLVEERKAKEDQRYRETLIKKVREREKLRIEMENYRQEIQIQKERQFKEEEEKFREEHLRYLAERDKLDLLSDEKRRRKKLEHSKALREMIEIRRCHRANAIRNRIVDFEKLISGERERDQLIEEERKRILSDAPKELLSYLPPGVLRSSDKEFLTLPGQKT
ncbi:meiosis-specific nuclear structural protein 1-like [Calliphora vicina]|uniref:meiosis-specific nuclear structural protein 1-like n=1 Tax=Calliphora vicina TaxID=7373 RepID=UPI00325BBB70